MGPHPPTADGVVGAEQDLDELAEARGVLVAHCFGVAERLQQRVALDDLILHLPSLKQRIHFASTSFHVGFL